MQKTLCMPSIEHGPHWHLDNILISCAGELAASSQFAGRQLAVMLVAACAVLPPCRPWCSKSIKVELHEKYSLSRSARSFPRFIRVREDKRPEDATGPDVICQLFRAQTRKMETAQEAVAARARGKARPVAAAGAPAGDDEELDDGAAAEASSNEAGDAKDGE